MKRFTTSATAIILFQIALLPLLPGWRALAADEETGYPSAEHQWLAENFSGAFSWNFLDLETGGVVASGSGNCEMIYGNQFLRCVHLDADGNQLGVGISGYHLEKQKNQWAYFGAGSTAMLFGEGARDPATGESIIEGKQKISGSPEFTFRTVTRQRDDGVWLYSHYRLDGETAVEMFRATFDYR